MQIEDRVHSRIGASSADRWLNCPQAPQVSAGHKREPNEYMAQGTVAHMVAEKCLKEGRSPEDFTFEVVTHDGFEVEIDLEIVEGVDLYVKTVAADMALYDLPQLYVEQGFHLGYLHEDLYGTNDACLTEAFGGVLRVYDFKFGVGKPVEVEDNPQLKIYALGALGLVDDVEEIELVIVQPRALHRDGPVRRWRISPADLRAWAQAELAPKARATRDPSAPFNPNKDWCGWCPALGFCPAVRKQAVEVFDVPFDEAAVPAIPVKDLPLVEQMTPEQIGRMLQFKPLAEKLLKAVYERAKTMLIENPEAIPGFKLVEGRANRSWVDNFEEVNGPLFMVLKQEMYDVKFKSPARMEAALKSAGADPKAVAPFVKVSRGLQVAPDFDKRPAFTPVENMFPDDTDYTDV